MTSPSSIGRESECLASVVLPHSKSVGQRAIRGTALHRFLCAMALIVALQGTPEYDDAKAEALESVPEEWRLAAAQIDLSRLPPLSEWVPEIAIAWDPMSGEARELGRNGAVEHDAVRALLRPGEIGGIIDLLGLTEDAVVVLDYKFSFGATIDKAEINGQLRAYAVLASALFKKDRAHLVVARIPDSGVAWFSMAELDMLGLDAATTFVRQHLRDVEAAKMAFRNEGAIPTPTEGTWCGFCPAQNACPAKVGLLLATLAGDEGKAAELALLPEPLSEEAAARLWPKLVQAEKLIERLKGNVKNIARIWGGLKLENGNVLSETESPRESIDPTFARPVLEARFGTQQTNTAIKTEETLTKASLDTLLRAHSSHGKMAKLKREVMAQLDEAGALRTVITHGVSEVAPTSKKLRQAEEQHQLEAQTEEQEHG